MHIQIFGGQMFGICKYVFVFMMFCAGFAARATETDFDTVKPVESIPITDNSTQNLHYDAATDSMPLVSVNTDSILDLNWATALDFSDPVLRPTPITVPFLTDYPIDNLEIKLRVLNLKF